MSRRRILRSAHAARPRPFRLRVGAAGIVAALGLGLGGCGFGVQTLQPYTPAEGVNIDVGSNAPAGDGVKVRNLAVVADPASGRGFLSGQLIAGAGDTLTAVGARALSQDGQPAGDLQVTLPGGKIPLPAGGSVVLTEGGASEVSGTKLVPGYTAELQLSFAKAGTASLTVPVLDRTQPEFVTVSPTPAPSTGGSGAPSPTATPTP